MIFNYSEEKDNLLKEKRQISFKDIIAILESEKILGVRKNRKYNNQEMYIIEVDNYVWAVPYVKNGDEVFLKTAFPDRKLHREYKHLLSKFTQE